jgi:HD-GYP domain-containing protein (c-di-GMP phosphodiesterase class II)
MGLAPAYQLIPVSSQSLQHGMFVAELDRSWLHSPFPAAGFMISSTTQLEQLRSLCHYVYIDPLRSETLPVDEDVAEEEPPLPFTASTTDAAPTAALALDVILHSLAQVIRGARRQGLVDEAAVRRCAHLVVERVLADADALHWSLRVDAEGSYLHRRAVGTAIVAATLGVQLGFERASLQCLAIGGLLLDLGKIAVPVPILVKSGALIGAEQWYVRLHVERGMQLTARHEWPARVREMIGGHHERLDGSGYPGQLRGTQIPLFARIAAIADAWDAMTLDRRYAAALSPHAALMQLENLSDRYFDAALVHELRRAIGAWPVGTLVELADLRVGLVFAQHQLLHPRVIVTHDSARHPLAVPTVLMAAGDVAVRRALAPHSVMVDTAALRPYLPRR